MKKTQNPFVNRYPVYLPSTVDLDDFLFDDPITETSYYKNKPIAHKDRIAFILGHIYFSLVKSKKVLLPENDFTSVCCENLKRGVHNYDQYIKYLKRINVLETDDSYHFDKVGNSKTFCKKYRYSPSLFDENTKWVRYVIYDSTLLENIDRSHSYQKTNQANMEYGLLRDCFNNLDINLNEAKKILKLEYPNELNNYNIQMDRVRRIKTPKYWTFKLGETNRLYNPISNIKKSLRPLLRINGEPLVEIDIKNSIPYMSLVLFDNVRLMKLPIIHDFLIKSSPFLSRDKRSKRCMDIRRNIIGGIEIESYLFMGKEFQGYDLRKRNNVKRYIDLVKSGEIYEFMAEKWNSDSSVKTTYSRGTAKKHLLSIFNRPPKFVSAEKKILHSLFPDVVKMFDRVNEGYHRTSRGKGGQKKKSGDINCPFAYFTQKLEAHLILDLVAMDLVKSNPGLNLYTIHDAIYTTKDNAKLVEEKLIAESKKLLGFSVIVDVKELCPDCYLETADTIFNAA